ncbi:MAG: flagellar motor protein MotA [Geminicoccaceae bacterium]
MSNPQRYVNRSILFLVLALAMAGALYQIILRAFQYNPYLNGLILLVLLFGVFYNLRRMLRLKAESRWIAAVRNGTPGVSLQDAPRLMAPIAAVLGERQRKPRVAALSALSMRYLLDSTHDRLDENRDIARYLTGLLIFLGLLGTFWGLLESIQTISGVISGLTVSSGDLGAAFESLKAGLSRPLTGMGTAFSASLFGLAGSLLLGFLDLQASQAEHGFALDVEEWLSGQTRLTGPEGPVGEGGPAMPAYVSALLQQTADNLERIEELLARSESERGELRVALGNLAQSIGTMATSQQALAQQLGQTGAGMLDPATRDHIRNTDVQIARLIEEMGRGRQELTRELRNEIKLVARTIAIIAGEPQAVRD